MNVEAASSRLLVKNKRQDDASTKNGGSYRIRTEGASATDITGISCSEMSGPSPDENSENGHPAITHWHVQSTFIPAKMVGATEFESATSSMSRMRSNQLS